MGKSIIIVLVVLLLGGGIYFALYNKSGMPQTAPAAPQTVNTPPQPAAPGQPMTGIPVINGTTTPEMTQHSLLKTFTITGTNYAFSPSEIRVGKGDTVRITFKNEGGFHSFNIGEFHVATSRLQTGNVEAVEFVADKTGTFEYYCSVDGHRAMGMKGTLVVE